MTVASINRESQNLGITVLRPRPTLPWVKKGLVFAPTIYCIFSAAEGGGSSARVGEDGIPARLHHQGQSEQNETANINRRKAVKNSS